MPTLRSTPAGKHNLTSVTPSPSQKKKAKEADTMDIAITDKENADPELIFPDDGFVSTSTNDRLFDISMQFPEDSGMKKKAKEPYKGLFGEGEEFAHDDIPRLMRIVYKILAGQENPPKSTSSLTLDEWAVGCGIIGRNDEALDDSKISDEDIILAKTIMSRLAHTTPKAMFGAAIQRSKTASTNPARAWHGAVFVIGSHYKKKAKKVNQAVLNLTGNKLTVEHVKENKETKSDKPSTKKSKKGKSVAFLEIDDEMEEADDEMVKPSGKETSKKFSKQTTIASVPRKDRVRLLMKIYVAGQKGTSPAVTFLKIFKSLMDAVHEDDETMQLLPWDLEESKKPVIGVNNMDKFPSSKAEFMPYTSSLKLRNNGNVWVNTHWACDANSKNLASTSNECGVDWWYDDHQAAAYLCTVQDSAHSVDVADFLYSGGFVSCSRLVEVIQHMCVDKYGKRFRIGARVKPAKELENPDKDFKKPYKPNGHWALDENKIIHLEADKGDADALMVLLKPAFKPNIDRCKRPGLYDIRIMPEKNFVRAGSSGSQDRVIMLKKHQAVVQSLGLVRNNQIKTLDEEFQCNKIRYTLRKFLMKLTFPLVIKEEDKKEYLIQSVDFADSGNDKKSGTVYVTAYNDRVELVQRLVDIPPRLVERMLHRDAAKKWFHATAIAHAPEVDFDTDDDGNWNGAWTTEDDEINQEVLAEDMGIKFEGLDFMGSSNPVILTTDDASMQSFGMSFGMMKQQSKETEDKQEADEDSGSESALSQVATAREGSGRSDE